MAYEVIIERTTERPTAVVKANTTWREFPTLWRTLLDDVWAFLRRATPGLRADGHNVMLYRNGDREGEVAVEVGVQVTKSFEAAGRDFTGVRWEIYGDPDRQTGHFDVAVYWQLT